MRASVSRTLTSAGVLVALLGLAAAPVGADGSVPNPNQTVDVSLTPTQLAESLLGAGVAVSNVAFAGGAESTGSFAFNDPTVVGFGSGIVLSSGRAADVVGPNVSDSTSTDFSLPGDADLTTLSGFPTQDAAVLEFDFTPVTNQVVFQYAFASDEYSEWVDTGFNDVFAFFVNGQNCATVRSVAGDPTAAFVPVDVNNINNSNPVHIPPPTPMRPDLFRDNSFNAAGPSVIDAEFDGITRVLTCQSAVNPGVPNHMKLAVADASDGIYDTSVFIQASSLVSTDNPVADLSVTPSSGPAPLDVTAIVEAEDPDNAPMTYSINWGDGTPNSTGELPIATDTTDPTALEPHTFTSGGTFIVTLTVSNGTLTGSSTEDVDVSGGGGGNAAPVVTGNPDDQSVVEGDLFSFSASASGVPAPTVQWQVSTDNGGTFTDLAGATDPTYGGTAALADDGSLYRAVFTNGEGDATTTAALLSVAPLDTTPPTLAPTFAPVDPPFLVSATGITASPNASDSSGILAESCGAVITSTAGLHSVTCTATDNAFNDASLDVPYVVGYAAVNVTPASDATFRPRGSIPVSFQLHDANGVISDQTAAALKTAISVTLDGGPSARVSYSKKANEFSGTLKLSNAALGAHEVAIRVTVGGTEVTTVLIPVTVA